MTQATENLHAVFAEALAVLVEFINAAEFIRMEYTLEVEKPEDLFSLGDSKEPRLVLLKTIYEMDPAAGTEVAGYKVSRRNDVQGAVVPCYQFEKEDVFLAAHYVEPQLTGDGPPFYQLTWVARDQTQTIIEIESNIRSNFDSVRNTLNRRKRKTVLLLDVDPGTDCLNYRPDEYVQGSPILQKFIDCGLNHNEHLGPNGGTASEAAKIMGQLLFDLNDVLFGDSDTWRPALSAIGANVLRDQVHDLLNVKQDLNEKFLKVTGEYKDMRFSLERNSFAQAGNPERVGVRLSVWLRHYPGILEGYDSAQALRNLKEKTLAQEQDMAVVKQQVAELEEGLSNHVSNVISWFHAEGMASTSWTVEMLDVNILEDSRAAKLGLFARLLDLYVTSQYSDPEASFLDGAVDREARQLLGGEWQPIYGYTSPDVMNHVIRRVRDGCNVKLSRRIIKGSTVKFTVVVTQQKHAIKHGLD